MRTVGVHTPSGPDALEIINVPVPVPTGRDLLIKVHAAGVNVIAFGWAIWFVRY